MNKQAGWGWTAADIGIGSIPGVGSVWNAGRGVYNLGKGVTKWVGGDKEGAKDAFTDAAVNGAGVALGLVGAGGIAAGARATMAGAKAVGQAGRLARLGQGVAKTVGNAAQGTGAVARGAQMAQTAGSAIKNTYNTAATAAKGLETAQATAIANAAKGTGVTAAGARGLIAAGTKMNNATNAVANWKVPLKGTQIGQKGAQNVVQTGAQIGISTPLSAAANIAVGSAPLVPAVRPQYAPSWYTAVTGDTTMPQY